MKRILTGSMMLLALVGAPAWAQDGRGRPLTIDEAVAVALRQSRDLRQARLALDQADGQVREAWGNVFPTLNLTSTYTRSFSVPGSFLPRIFVDPTAGPDELIAVKFGADNTWAMSVRAEQPLFEARAFIGVGAAARYRALQDEVVRGRAREVATSTRLAFYDVLLAQEAVRLSDNSVKRVRQALEETQSLYRAGLVSEYDVLRLQVELANLEPNLRRAQNGVTASRRRLGVELGLDGMEELEVAGSLGGARGGDVAGAGAGAVRASGPLDVETLPVDELVALAERNRSDLRQLDLTAQLRQVEIQAERSEYLPRVALFGVYSLNAQQSGRPDFFGASAAQRAYGRQAGIQVTMPIFSGFQRPARLAQKEAVLRQVRTQRDQVAATAENQVRTLLDQVTETRQRADAQRLAVSQAERGFQIASAMRREGTGSQLELTDAEVALRQSEYNQAQALYEYLVARARLEEAVGMVPMVDAGDRPALENRGDR